MVSASFTARPPQLQLPLYYPTVTSEPMPEYHALNGLVDLHSLDPLLFSVGGRAPGFPVPVQLLPDSARFLPSIIYLYLVFWTPWRLTSA